MAKKQATKFVKTQQVAEVMDWMTNGKSRQWVLQKSAELWGYQTRATDELIKKAREEFTANWENVDRKEFVSELMAKYHLLFEKGLEQRQLAVSHAALTAMGKMLGVDGAVR